MPPPWRKARRRSINAPREGSVTIHRPGSASRVAGAALEPGQWRGNGAAGRLDRRGTLHRLRPLPRALSRGRHRGRCQISAHGADRPLHGVRTLPAALSGRLHRTAAGPAARGQPGGAQTANASMRTALDSRIAPSIGSGRWMRRKPPQRGVSPRHECGQAACHIRAAAPSEPASAHRVELSLALRTPGGGRPLGAGHRQEREQGDGEIISRRRHTGRPAGPRRERPVAVHPIHRPVQRQGQEPHRHLPPAAGEARRAGARGRARNSKICPASEEKPPMWF